MPSITAVAILLSVAVSSHLAYRFHAWRRRTAHLFCYGRSGIIGYYSTALKYTFNTVECIDDASRQCNGRPFIMPTLFHGPLLILGPQYIDFVRTSNENILSQKEAILKATQLDYTLDPHQMNNPYAIGVLLGEVTREIDRYIPDVAEETALALEALLSKNTTVPIFLSMTDMVARVVNRSFVGPDLCRRQDYIRAVVRYARTFIFYGMALKLLPNFLKSVAYDSMAALFGGKKAPLIYLRPHIHRYISQRESGKQAATIVEALLAASGENAEQLAMRIVALNFGSIHTLSIVITQTLLEIAAMPLADIELIRAELDDAIVQGTGWSKLALSRCQRLDSLLREAGRLHGVTIFSAERLTVKDTVFPGGIMVPAETMVSVSNLAVHLDPKIYPEPHKFDAFRFYKHHNESDHVKHNLATIDSNNYLLFGLGRHACAGRFFAATTLKIIVATVLLQYHVTLADSAIGLPKNRILSGVILPDSAAKLKFIKRMECGVNSPSIPS
ncbi:cytochrome P450 [Mycena galericulata]|nr:cytochrome P450 [Mycena galericulata]